MLVPSNLVKTAARNTTALREDVLAYALAYVERCRGYVPLLERERELLLAAQEEAWRRELYGQVVQLVSGLAYLAGRLGNFEQGQRILLQGIHACRETGDQQHLAHFLYRLSALLHAQGEYNRAIALWEESLSAAHKLGQFAHLWEPLCSFAYVVDIPREYEKVQHFARALLEHHPGNDLDTIAAALFIRGFGQHTAGNISRACEDYTACLHLLASYTHPSVYKHFFEIEIQAELARVQGDFARAHDFTLVALALSEALCDPYITAVLLWDEFMFAHRQGILNDSYPLASYLVSLSKDIKAPHFFRWCLFVIQQLPASLQDDLILKLSHHAPPAIRAQLPPVKRLKAPSQERLISEREQEVLRLVAAGLSNRDIAGTLVITTGTVKKHLEHIYNKLDVHSRTQLIFKARALGLLQ